MSESMLALQRKMSSANDLRSVVRTMKAMAAANISQYEKAVLALDDYYRTVQLGLIACLHDKRETYPILASNEASTAAAKEIKHSALPCKKQNTSAVGVIIFGSDQGLVGQFNDRLFNFMRQTHGANSAANFFWPVGERMYSRLTEGKYKCAGNFALPRSIDSVTSLVTELLLEIERPRQQGKVEEVYLYFNQPISKTSYSPTVHKLLPLDNQWRQELAFKQWPGTALPQLINGAKGNLISLLHEYLFVSLFKACTASLASENASRLTAMQRAEKNIEELHGSLYRRYHQQRQHAVDEELFDLIGGFEALSDS
jgi:F-type H+-transporting ATPase subunit gamma